MKIVNKKELTFIMIIFFLGLAFVLKTFTFLIGLYPASYLYLRCI